MSTRIWMIVALVVSLPLVARAQPAEISPEQRVRTAEVELKTCDYLARQVRHMLADELRQAIERALKAEAALATQQARAAARRHQVPATRTE